MRPFCSDSGTAAQVSRIWVELTASAETFSGGAEGTASTQHYQRAEIGQTYQIIFLRLPTCPGVFQDPIEEYSNPKGLEHVLDNPFSTCIHSLCFSLTISCQFISEMTMFVMS